jgi:PAS domain S-box-containing protein
MLRSLFDNHAQVWKRLGSGSWSLRTRIVILVLSLAIPLNLLVFAIIWQLSRAAEDTQRSGLLYTARTVSSAIDTHIGKFISLAQALANSPALLADDLAAFAPEALGSFPTSGDAWLLVADLDGRQLFNSAMRPGQTLPPRNPTAIAAQRRAVETRTVIVAEQIVFGPLTQTWVATIEIPVFREGLPFRVLAVALKMPGLQKLLSGHQIPPRWLAGIIDAQGRFLARVPQPERYVGQVSSRGWRHIKDQEGVFEFVSLEGEIIVQGNAHPSLAPAWAIGIAVPVRELRAAAWSTVRWAALVGVMLSGLSLALAFLIARHIERPIAALRARAGSVLEGAPVTLPDGLPEVKALAEALQAAAADRKRGEEASQRLAAIVRSSFDAIISKRLDGIVTSWNASAEHMFGYAAPEMIGQSIRRLIPPDRQHEEDEILRKLAANQRVEPFETIRLRKDGRTLPVSLTISPLVDGRGEVMGASKVVRDISEQKARENQVNLLLQEVSHRSKNLLSVVQAIANRSASDNTSEFLHRFSQRLQALAVNQDLLISNEWQGIDLEKLLRAQLAPFAPEERVRLHGPAIQLSAASAQAIGMAVHELATNASKYGALSTEDGIVELIWTTADGIFTLSWAEQGGPPVSPPVSQGFGSVVTSTLVRQSLDAKVKSDYARSGLRWRVQCPIANIAAK